MTIALLLLSLVWWTEKIICPISSTLWPVDLKMNFSQFSKKKKNCLLISTGGTWQQHDMDEWTFLQSWKYTCWRKCDLLLLNVPLTWKLLLLLLLVLFRYQININKMGNHRRWDLFLIDWLINQSIS